jgi:hypothetical protein
MTKTKTKKAGNAGCVLCGLRASSKNVAIRNVFPIWPETCQIGNMFDLCMRIQCFDGHDMFGLNVGIHKQKESEPDGKVFADFLKDFILNYDPKMEHLHKLFCGHQWKQDRGTATV